MLQSEKAETAVLKKTDFHLGIFYEPYRYSFSNAMEVAWQ
jgi:hypothetical protein